MQYFRLGDHANTTILGFPIQPVLLAAEAQYCPKCNGSKPALAAPLNARKIWFNLVLKMIVSKNLIHLIFIFF
jgi:hypothetical protein